MIGRRYDMLCEIGKVPYFEARHGIGNIDSRENKRRNGLGIISV